MNVLDCTLRDGGYHVNWDFDPNTVRKYFSSLETAKIDLIEVGFRSLPSNKFRGAFAYSTDDYLTSLNIPEGIPIAVMINASEIVNYKGGEKRAVNFLFDKKEMSPVDIVRIAVKAVDVSGCQGIVNLLAALGYRVFLNLMQIDSVSPNEITDLVGVVSTWDCVEVLYFADSFGSLEPVLIEGVVQSMRKAWNKPIGAHFHDNKGLALQNTLAAIKCGVDYVDSTLNGIGRGAGNTKTEYLLAELASKEQQEYFPDAVFPLVLQEFNSLQKEHEWGPNIYYYLSALHGIHPTYIQEMLGDERYGTDQILSSINFLKKGKAPFFSFENMIRAAAGVDGDENGSWSVAGMFEGKTVLVIGAGPSTKKYKVAIEQYINKYQPFVLCLNVNDSVSHELVDAYVACHETRILIESDRYELLNKPFIIPLSRVPPSIVGALSKVEILDYGLRISNEDFTIQSTGCALPKPLALSYAIAAANAGGAKRIVMVGIDGYNESDKRQKEMVDILKRHHEYSGSIPMVALTPTTYPVERRSIFDGGGL